MTSFYILSSSLPADHPSFAAKQNKLTLSSVKKATNKNSIPRTGNDKSQSNVKGNNS
jgi:hypothetical protein